MKKLLCAAFAFGVIGLTACKSKAEKEAAEKSSYEQTKETLAEKERNNPLKFLSVAAKDKRNLIGQTVIKGTIFNNAKVSSYKDIELELSFFSKTGELLEKDSDKVFEVIEPGKSVEFKTKLRPAKGTDSVAIHIIQAKAE